MRPSRGAARRAQRALLRFGVRAAGAFPRASAAAAGAGMGRLQRLQRHSPSRQLQAEDVFPPLYADDGLLRQPVLRRGAVGVASLQLNLDRKPGDGGRGGAAAAAALRARHAERPTESPATCAAAAAHLAYAPLTLRALHQLEFYARNAEVNSTQKALLLSARRGAFAEGVADEYLLELHGSAAKRQEFVASVAHCAYVVGSYQKPLLAVCDGQAADEGAALLCLANHAACTRHAQLRFDFARRGLAPLAGASYLLARAAEGWGEYLALTGAPVGCADALHLGLALFWMSHAAIPFLEYSSEGLLEVTEHDATGLLREHILTPPPPSLEMQTAQKFVRGLFGRATSFEDLIDRLKKAADLPPAGVATGAGGGGAGAGDERVAGAVFAADSLARMRRRPLLQQRLTFELIREARRTRLEALRRARISETLEENCKSVLSMHPSTVGEASTKFLAEVLEKKLLQDALQLETAVLWQLLSSKGFASGLMNGKRNIKQTSLVMKTTLPNVGTTVIPSVNIVNEAASAPSGSSKTPFLSAFLAGAFGGAREPAPRVYFPEERCPTSYSQHPWLRTVHPHYNPKTRLDFEPSVALAREHETSLLEALGKLRRPARTRHVL